MILHGIEYQRPTSLNMRILADHVTYSFLAFMKSIFHFCLGCYCGGYSQNGRSNLSSLRLQPHLPAVNELSETVKALEQVQNICTGESCYNTVIRDHFVYAPSQWETMLHCNVVSHWLGAYTKCSLCHLSKKPSKWTPPSSAIKTTHMLPFGTSNSHSFLTFPIVWNLLKLKAFMLKTGDIIPCSSHSWLCFAICVVFHSNLCAVLLVLISAYDCAWTFYQAISNHSIVSIRYIGD